MSKNEKWTPNVGDHYKTIMWSASLGFHTHDCIWENDDADRSKLENGNVFQYVSEAQCWCNAFNQCINNPLKALKNRDECTELSNEWISVSEKLPDKLRSNNGTLDVLFTDGKNIYRGIYDHKYKIWLGYNMSVDIDLFDFSKTITHWMHIPSLPK